MPQLLDARGLACPLPAIKAKAALAALPPARRWSCSPPTPRRRSTSARWPPTRATRFRAEREGAVWRLTLTKEAG